MFPNWRLQEGPNHSKTFWSELRSLLNLKKLANPSSKTKFQLMPFGGSCVILVIKLTPFQSSLFSWAEPNTLNYKYGVWINYERLFQLETAQPFFPSGLAGKLGIRTALVQTKNFSCADPMHRLFPTLPKNADNMEWFSLLEIYYWDGQLSSMYESTGVRSSILVSPNSNKVRLMWTSTFDLGNFK